MIVTGRVTDVAHALMRAVSRVTTGEMTCRPDRRHGLQFSGPTVGGLFLHVHCARMLLAVKGSFAMIQRIMPLTASGHSQRTLSLQEEKAALDGPYRTFAVQSGGHVAGQPCQRSASHHTPGPAHLRRIKAFTNDRQHEGVGFVRQVGAPQAAVSPFAPNPRFYL